MSMPSCILMVRALWRELGLKEGEQVALEINCLGQPEERSAHRAALIKHFEANAEALDAEARRRLHTNPLRILDTKNPAMTAVVDAAPRLADFLGAASLAHFDGLRALLDGAGLAYKVNPRLVRGLDYYGLTVFEWTSTLLGAQATVCGGGRYDRLIETLGGKPAPGIGFGMGLERLMLILEAAGIRAPSDAPQAYAVVPDVAVLPRAMHTLVALRAAGVRVVMHAGGGSMKAQFKRADASGAAFALIFGGDEVAAAQVAIKPLRRGEGAPQFTRALDSAADWAHELRAS